MFIVGFVAALSLMVDWGLARGSERMFGPDHPIETEWVAFWGSADSQTAVDGQTTGAADATPPGSPEQADAGPTFGEQLSARADSHARLLTAQSVEWPALMAVGIGLGLLGLLFAFRVDINEFSMHRYYRNRLVRCYLGASNTRRAGQSFTGFDPNDDLQLALVSKRAAEADGWRYPYPIINSALNLVRKGNLAWQDRKAAAFFFSPLYCGFEVPDWEDRRASGAGGPASPGQARRRLGGFRPTHDYGSPGAPLKSLLRVILGLRPAIDKKIDEKKDEVPDGGIGLGTAFAISGAAASPNMGFRTTPALSFLMTVFNVRLGWWLGNPSRDGWKRPGPTLALKCLFSELFGLTTIDSKFVYLSDGGHFENLGLYELVRRRCRYVVLCDVGQDQDIWFADLGNAIRKCYTDFGARVEIGVNPIRREVHPYTQEESEFNGSHFTLGTIHYPDQDGAPVAPGKLLYIKSSVTGDEPTDVLHYFSEHKDFPHESTADQWFDESQFESYRALGRHIGLGLLEKTEDQLRGGGNPAADVRDADWADLFSAFDKIAESDTPSQPKGDEPAEARDEPGEAKNDEAAPSGDPGSESNPGAATGAAP